MVHQHGDHHDVPDHCRVHRHGSWLPTDHRIHHAWLRSKVAHVDAHPSEPLAPALQEFADLIETNPRIYMHFAAMWDEVPRRPCYRRDPTGERQIRDYKHMLQVLNHVFTRAPEWTDAAAHVGMVGVPLNAVFDYVMGTPSGHAAFLDPEVNRVLKKVLNSWGGFLKTPQSVDVLGDHKTGWFGPVAISDLMEVANAPLKTSYKFEEMYLCDPSAKHYGFKSWDDFFTRRLHPSSRPVASPSSPLIITSACESRPYHITHHALPRDRFWIKSQPYSVLDMLAHHPLAGHFAPRATVYQAFLSALSYHRWHAPVSGVVRAAFVQDGTYFSEPLCEHAEASGVETTIDRGGMATAQGYLTALATRAVIFIEAEAKEIGLMAFVGVGMDEVSTCEITVKEGQRVEKGDEMGMFHFGGSSHCLLFREEVKVRGFPEVGGKTNVPVRGRVCVVEA
ncbi:Phophatidylserine decarboxylase-domain-containing protein [Schizothecium vesticola]|uniref:Phophatidylserine decarboxylase-domain-containing protein n=1 Tax=Schizothecium vesticola TaxID=314040 RepID=A0AA40K8L6_9PEZI|nr:Phophatidylserine decarboxylase-domain-containing protein [Schizothecium vesticola]